MQTLAAVLKEKRTKKENIYINTIDNCQLDDLLDELTTSGLISQSFRPWYARRARDLGLDLFRILSRIALADGRQPARYFSYLLKHGYRTYLPQLPQADQAGLQA